MALVYPLVAAACAFASALTLMNTRVRDVGLVGERLRRGARRNLEALVARLSHTRLVALLMERPDWDAAATRLVEAARSRSIDLQKDNAVAALTLVGVLMGCLCGLLFWSPVSAIAALAAERVALSWRRSKDDRDRERAVSREMPSVLRTLSVALSAGQTLAQAIDYVGKHGEGTVSKAFAAASLRLRCGMSTEASLDEISRELEAPGMEMLITALVISHRTGSPLRELLTRSAALVERQEEFRRTLSAKTAQVRLSARIVCTLPFLMVVLLSLISPDFQRGLMSATGAASILVAALLDALAVLLIRKIMRGVFL